MCDTTKKWQQTFDHNVHSLNTGMCLGFLAIFGFCGLESNFIFIFYTPLTPFSNDIFMFAHELLAALTLKCLKVKDIPQKTVNKQ